MTKKLILTEHWVFLKKRLIPSFQSPAAAPMQATAQVTMTATAVWQHLPTYLPCGTLNPTNPNPQASSANSELGHSILKTA